MVIALLIIGLIGCIVWGHHMFIVGFDIDTRSYFTITTSIIAIPTGIKIINWIMTIWGGVGTIYTSILFILGFIFSFTFGGVTGLILANCMIDTLLHDSYFVVGHFLKSYNSLFWIINWIFFSILFIQYALFYFDTINCVPPSPFPTSVYFCFWLIA
jgi:cytochrome c oxidase subunit 1